jgi:hypothetical protein
MAESDVQIPSATSRVALIRSVLPRELPLFCLIRTVAVKDRKQRFIFNPRETAKCVTKDCTVERLLEETSDVDLEYSPCELFAWNQIEAGFEIVPDFITSAGVRTNCITLVKAPDAETIGPRITSSQIAAFFQLAYQIDGKVDVEELPLKPSRVFLIDGISHVLFDVIANVGQGKSWADCYSVYSALGSQIGARYSAVEYGQFVPLPRTAKDVKYQSDNQYSWDEIKQLIAGDPPLAAVSKNSNLLAESVLHEESSFTHPTPK